MPIKIITQGLCNVKNLPDIKKVQASKGHCRGYGGKYSNVIKKYGGWFSVLAWHFEGKHQSIIKFNHINNLSQIPYPWLSPDFKGHPEIDRQPPNKIDRYDDVIPISVMIIDESLASVDIQSWSEQESRSHQYDHSQARSNIGKLAYFQ